MDFHPLTAGADDRFDELTIRVLIPAIDQLGQRLGSIRSLVVGAREVEWTERVMCRTNHEQTSKAAIELFECITQRGRLERREILAGAAAKFLATGPQLVRLAFR